MVRYLVEPLSPMALPDAQASVSFMVEPLSPMALPDAQAAASSGFRLFCLTGCGAFEALIDWGQSIYHFRSTRKRRRLSW